MGFSPSESFPVAKPVPFRFPNPHNVRLLSRFLGLGRCTPLLRSYPRSRRFHHFQGLALHQSVFLSLSVTLTQNPLLSWGFVSLWRPFWQSSAGFLPLTLPILLWALLLKPQCISRDYVLPARFFLPSNCFNGEDYRPF